MKNILKPKSYKLKSRSGFTLIEMLLVIGLIVILAAVTLANLVQRRSRGELDSATKQIAGILREAQSRGTAQASSSIWGVHFENQITSPFYALFSGSSYSSTTNLGYYTLPASIRYATSNLAVSVSRDVTFAQVTGFPSSATSVVIEYLNGNVVAGSSTISISDTGLISF